MVEVDIYDAEAPFYDALHDVTEDIPLYLEYAKATSGLVLECGVGTGRIAIPLARQGITVLGIDANEKMLKIAREKIAKETREVQKRVKLAKADMRNFRLKVEDQESTLRTIHKHLLPKGILMISVFNPDLTRPQNVVRLETVKQVKDQLLMRFYTQSFDFPNQTTSVQHIDDLVKPDGSVRRVVLPPLKIRYVFYDEMRHLLTRTGYEVEGVFRDEKKSPFQSGSRLMIFVARKS